MVDKAIFVLHKTEHFNEHVTYVLTFDSLGFRK